MTNIGVDIVKVDRFSNVSTSFLKRVFHPLELKESESIKNKANYFAKRFAAKEALYKAINNDIAFKDIAVLNYDTRAPYFKTSLTNSYDIKLSLSDEKDYAIAFVMVESL